MSEEELPDIICEDHILNEKNQYITKKKIEQILGKYGISYKVKDINLFIKALTHKSYVKHRYYSDETIKLLSTITPIENESKRKAIPLQDECYEKLEFFGDEVIKYGLTMYIYQNYRDTADEGVMTILRANIEKSSSLSRLAIRLGLLKYLLMGRKEENEGGRKKKDNRFAEDILEAFFGALDIDSNFDQTATRFLFRLIEYKEIDIEELRKHNDNYKDILMRYFHKEGWGHPEYITIEEVNPNTPQRKYIMGVLDQNGKRIGKGIGRTKKSGQKEAALDALIDLGVGDEFIG
jgi:ribonuclease-3